MNSSIQHFQKNGIPNLEKITEKFMCHPTMTAEFIYGVKDVFLKTALEYIGDVITEADKAFRRSNRRLAEWVVVKTDTATKTTHIGDFSYEKTLFKNKTTGERKYLVDVFLGFEPHDRLTEDALAEMFKEAVETSYRRGGKAASILSWVSKETVKDHLHELEFPEEMGTPLPLKKRTVEYLFIEADEDHIHLQFKVRKGDLRANKLKRKLNCAIEKLVYVHEGIKREGPKSKRRILINPHYLSGAYEGEKNKDLWDMVYEYIDSHYEIDKIKKIYISSDGGEWIKAGMKRLHGLTHVLDEFHLRKRLLEMTRHVDGNFNTSDQVMLHALLNTIRRDTKENFKSYVDFLLFKADDNEATKRRVRDGADYILNNWMAAKTRLAKRDKVPGSSTEGHVSHVLSSRMSTQSLGWSRRGADRMAHLRAYYWNKGDMLELVRYQKTVQYQEMPKAAGAENDPISAAQMIASEHLDVPDWAGNYERMQATVGDSVKKAFYLATLRVL